MEKLINITATGIRKGWSGFIWMLKILVPLYTCGKGRVVWLF